MRMLRTKTAIYVALRPEMWQPINPPYASCGCDACKAGAKPAWDTLCVPTGAKATHATLVHYPEFAQRGA